MTPPDEMPDDSTLARLAAGDGSVSEDVTYAQALAMEVQRLRERVALRDAAADAYDILVRRVWEAVTGDTHEGPASVDVLLEAVAGLRARADGAHLLAVRVVQATNLHEDPAAVDATPESAVATVRELRSECDFARGERGAVEALARRMEARALRAEAERDALRAAVREAFASGAAARSASDARFATPSAEAEAEWQRVLARCEAATARLHALAGEG